MVVNAKTNTHFTNLIEDKALANAYFCMESLDEYNSEKLEELKNNVVSSNRRYQLVSSVLTIVKFSNVESLVIKTSLQLEEERKASLRDKNQLEIFESNLAYLIASGKIESAEELGFSSAYITDLLDRKKKELKNLYVQYYYDEKTERTAKMVNGKLITLPYTPKSVDEELAKTKSKNQNVIKWFKRIKLNSERVKFFYSINVVLFLFFLTYE